MSLVSNRAVQCLQLNRTRHQLALSGVQGDHTGLSNCMVNFTLSSTHPSNSKIQLTAAVVNRVPCDPPLQGASTVRSLPYLQNLTLADPTFPGKVDLLIGCDAWQDVMKPEMKQGNAQEPMARNTIFGWVIIGRYVPDASSPASSCL